MATKEIPRATVYWRRDLTEDLMLMKLKVNVGLFLTFKPGQYCTLRLQGAKPKPYSIVSAPHELPMIELFIELVPKTFQREDSLTPKIWELKIGDTIEIFPSIKGVFVLEPEFERHVFVSTVTGVAPFVSMIRAMKKGFYNKQHQIYVFEGASYWNEFGYRAELTQRVREGWIQVFVPTISRPNEAENAKWIWQTGRVNEILFDQFDKLGITPKNTCVYVCGNEGMIESLTFGSTKRQKEAIEKEGKKYGGLIELGYTTREEAFF
jgi:ferredoxin/flavodoxin---NADP+ reductase